MKTETTELDARTRKVYADSLRNHRRYTNLVTQDKRWNETPYFVSLESLAVCNAACDFCPYPTLERKGTRMPEKLFQKIIDDLANEVSCEIPNFTLNRISEPFLDARTFDFAKYIISRFPTTKINRVTNASAMTDKMVDLLLFQGNTGYIRISFNDHRPDQYERTMQLPFERTYRNVKRLHDRVVAGELSNYIMIGRVGDGTEADADFVEWCRREFPAFNASVVPRFDWMGYTQGFNSRVLGQKCTQWFQLHFLADGREALCCIDATGAFGRGDANTENAYEIYMHPRRREMREAKSRRSIEACKSCTALV